MRNLDVSRRRLSIEESVTEVDGKMIFGTPKSHQQRRVPVPRSLISSLEAACAGKPRDALIFTAPQGGVVNSETGGHECSTKLFDAPNSTT